VSVERELRELYDGAESGGFVSGYLTGVLAVARGEISPEITGEELRAAAEGAAAEWRAQVPGLVERMESGS
jgi:hypothetical protein